MRARIVAGAVAAATLLAAVPSADGARGRARLPDPLAHPEVFANPPMEVRPKTRWWWATPYDHKEFGAEVDAIAKAGFGGVEAAFNTEGWATKEQRDALFTSLVAARRHGISFDMTMGASWPVTSPAVTGSNGELGEQELQYGRLDLVGPSVFAGPPPQPRDGTSGALRAVTAARVIETGPPAVLPQVGPNLSPTKPSTAPVVSTVLDPSSLVDLTRDVDDAGNLTWTVPDGHWIVFCLRQRTASEAVMDHFSTASATAVTKYIDANMLGPANARLLPSVGGSFFEDSLELDANDLMWTWRFADEFRKRRGYDVTKYIPLLFVAGAHHYPVWEEMPNADFDLTDGMGARVRHDYFQTLTDLYVDAHMRAFQRWARTHGMRFRTQAAFGAALDVTRSARELAEAGGIADDESLNAGDPGTLADTNWRFAMDHFRSVAGGVHQGGGSEISTELGAMFWREYQPGLADYKALMDKEFAAGITTPIIHGFAYQPPGAGWPGRQQFAGVVSESWNHRNYPQWKMWKPLTDYWARGALVLRQGRPQIDLAVYRDGFVTSAATFTALGTDAANHQVFPALPTSSITNPDGTELVDDNIGVKPSRFFDGEPLERAGYTFEYVDPGGLLERGARGRGVLFPGGPSYRALIVDERSLPAASAEAIARDAARGLAVVFVGDPPSRGTGYGNAKREDARVRVAVKRALSLASVRRVAKQAEVRKVLEKMGVRPAAVWSRDVPAYSAHRRGNGVDYWYLWNAGSNLERFTASFATRGSPYELDLWSGRIDRVGLFRAKGSRVEVPIRLTPGETMVLAFRHDEKPALHAVSADAEDLVAAGRRIEARDTRRGSRTVGMSDGSRRRFTASRLPAPVVPKVWKLHVDEVDPDGNIPHDLELTKLDDWRNIAEIANASGTGDYTASVNVPRSWVTARRGTYLELGLVEGAMAVFVNGKRAVPNATIDRPSADAPNAGVARRFDVSRFLRPGANTLRIVVTTTLKNKIFGMTKSGRVAGALAAVQPATQPYGLIGPVRLVPYFRVVLG
jgi:hypothetical protein